MKNITETVVTPIHEGPPQKESDNIAIAAVAPRMLKTTEKYVRETTNLAEISMEARKALMDALVDIGSVWRDWEKTSAGYIKEVRDFRMVVATELATAKRDLVDIRKFFLEKDHDQEVARIKEFVEVCERLQALKKSGTLDAMVDLVIKLS